MLHLIWEKELSSEDGTKQSIKEHLIENYTTIGYSQYSVFWRRLDQPLQLKKNIVIGSIFGDKVEFKLNRSLGSEENPKLAVVQLDYVAMHTYGFIPLIGRTSRFRITPKNTLNDTTISLPDYEKELRFPILLSGENVVRRFKFRELHRFNFPSSFQRIIIMACYNKKRHYLSFLCTLNFNQE